ncbi:MAG: NAD metabolism ATPase/kinase [Bacteroidetes bacterium GWF2_41_31]|nr:MAG: NAD metabolism ATPase/kinase [Bacteroidetes bacterium GWF2_41_31]
MFTKNDIKQMASKGITADEVQSQISKFITGFPFINLIAPAIPGKGLHQFSADGVTELVAYYNEQYKHYSILKFVPASGAASRMFKHLFEFRQKNDPEQLRLIESDKSFNSVHHFFHHLDQFAFYNCLKNSLKAKGFDLEKMVQKKQYNAIIDDLLEEYGLNYANLPKGLLMFHTYPNGSRVAMEEHLVEAAVYANDEKKLSRIHFTVSPEHQIRFEERLLEKREVIEKEYKTKFEVTFSHQKPATDTIAVTLENEPFRNIDGSLLFRPAGHGALIHNLNELDNEIIFIKNIDNIVPDRLRNLTYMYKKAIGGLLIRLQEQTFDFLDILDDGNVDKETLSLIADFSGRELNIDIPDAFEGYDEMEKIDFLFNKLNRPIRVCGMVKNEGEPGGGPFWVVNENGEKSLQIVESSQIDFSDKEQKDIVSKSTHFNPVDLVCGVYDFKGEKFNLLDFVDPNSGFISNKSKDGSVLKAMELPGLWNGAMTDWITIFIETPIITFNPVKTVNDLLRPQHQPE